MEELYKELLERKKYLKSIEQTEQVKARLGELMLMIVRVQQLLLPTVSVSDGVKVKTETLQSKVFSLANELAVNGYGDEAVKMHAIHNRMLK